VRATRGCLSAIASQIGAALETQRLVQDSLRQERLMRELELAHDLQLKLLPDPAAFEAPPEVAARCLPADSVGGDFYHLFRLPGDRFGIMIGDVSSHGFSAALIMALTMSAVAIYAQESGPPAEVMRHVHRALINELESTEMYLTLFYGVLDPTPAPRLRQRRAPARLPRGQPRPAPPAGRNGAAHGHCGAGRVRRGHRHVGRRRQPGLPVHRRPDRRVPGPRRGPGRGEPDPRRGVHARQPLEQVLDHIFAATAETVVNVPADDRTALIVRG
jgi:hypothetical protein